jgi:hypothetical protein
MNEEGADMEVARPVDRVARMREIENLGIDRDTYETIEREFQDFLQEIVGHQSLQDFKDEYEKEYERLKKSYKNEQELIKKCLEFNKQAMERAKSFNAAIKLAIAETEKIEALKGRKEKAFEELKRLKVNEEESRQDIKTLKIEIANLKRKPHA